MKLQGRQDRLREILNKIRVEQQTTLEELARFFCVSTATIRRDIKVLEEKSAVVQTVGGGIIYQTEHTGAVDPGRIGHRIEEKIRIAEHCTELIRDHDDVLIGPGTTTFLAGKIISGIEDRRFRIITSSLELALEAGAAPNIRAVVLGGEVWNKYVVGPRVGRGYFEECHRQHTMILSADGIEATRGVTVFESRLVPMIEAMVSVSSRIILATDSSKFGKSCFNRVARFDQLRYVVTDHDAPPDYVALLKEHGIDVRLV
ncbi:MAG: DeoR/GlpR transcriptional regulator [Spirochaetaceae bacterium]|nr:MAG: DeoR/GlpR transcriptional regulator [Spirochaetaceae bacterium]